MLGLHDGKTALKVTLNMVWVDLVKCVERKVREVGPGLISPGWGAFWKLPGFFTFSTQRLSAPITLESVTSLGTRMHKGNNPSVSHNSEGEMDDLSRGFSK